MAHVVSNFCSATEAMQFGVELVSTTEPDLIGLGLDIALLAARRDQALTATAIGLAEGIIRTAHEDVRWSAAHLLSSLEDPRALKRLLAFCNDDRADIRIQVVVAQGYRFTAWDTEIEQTVVALCDDADDEVRSCATFVLALFSDSQSDLVRQTLWRGVDDLDRHVGNEAILGLARLKDPRIHSVVGKRLRAPDVDRLIVLAATELASESLLPALRKLQESGWPGAEFELSAAITASAPHRRTGGTTQEG